MSNRNRRSSLEIQKMREGREAAWEVQKGCCKYCYSPLSKHELTADHRVPRSKGGSNLSVNIDALCKSCNTAKGSMNPGLFLREIKNPSHGASFPLLMAWSRRKVSLKMHRAIRNIGRMYGVEVNVPI